MNIVQVSLHKNIPVRTNAQVRDEFNRRGLSISEWARARGYSAQLVYQILNGRKQCLRGQSHAIAVALGLKVGQIGTIQDLDQALALEQQLIPTKEADK